MLIGMIILGVIAAWAATLALRGKKVSPETEEYAARVRRSVGGAAHNAPWLLGQAPAHLMPGPLKDEIGPDEGHIYVLPSGEPPDNAPPDGSMESSAAPAGEPG